MLGCCKPAAASASVRKRCRSSAAGQPAGQDHLQGDDAVEPALPGPVDDAHAAAADLLEQFVIAEQCEPAVRDGRARPQPGPP